MITTNDQERHRELAQFLRTRRERLSPVAMGLPTDSRRRTPGLRREELASMAGVGVTWYTRLEQGRNITVSAQVLESLARVFNLDMAERNHLFILARRQLPVDSSPLTNIINPELQCILNSMGNYPAYVTNPCWDIVAWNQAMCRVYTDFGLLPIHERNILQFMFTNPLSRTLLINWEREAQRVLTLFRASTERYIGEPWFIALQENLQQMSPEFCAWWPRHDIQATHAGVKELNHPLVGELVLQASTFQIIDALDLRMVIYTPLSEAGTVKKLAQLMEMREVQTVHQ